MDPVVHFELPYDNRVRMAKFYESVFGWQTQLLAEDMGNYVLATTTETDESGPKKNGVINGGFYPKKPDWPAQYPSIVIAVEDVIKKRFSREVQVHGSCGLAQTLIANDLIDKYRFLTFPMVLGMGKRLFGVGAVPAMLTLVRTNTTSKGVIVSVYRRAGSLKTGSFALD